MYTEQYEWSDGTINGCVLHCVDHYIKQCSKSSSCLLSSQLFKLLCNGTWVYKYVVYNNFSTLASDAPTRRRLFVPSIFLQMNTSSEAQLQIISWWMKMWEIFSSPSSIPQHQLDVLKLDWAKVVSRSRRELPLRNCSKQTLNVPPSYYILWCLLGRYAVPGDLFLFNWSFTRWLLGL